MESGRVTRITGALVEAEPLPEGALYELVHVGPRRLLGEVIRVERERASIQVFEETEGLALGGPVVPTGAPLAVHLGPGLLGATLDGLGRPLARVAEVAGDRIPPGVAAPTLDPVRHWEFRPARDAGDRVAGGDVLGVVDEGGIEHRILVPPDVHGVLAAVEAGSHAVEDAVAHLEDGRALGLAHTWPVRTPRPAQRRLRVSAPFITGQRVLDLLFPVGEGGAVAVPGGFGTGKTVIEQSLAKWGQADVVVYIGCGERGNEMAEVLEDFAELEDPRTGRLLRDRTVLVVNTSNMPVVAREASVYLGFTIAEYYRDMGYRVALMADSLSRWAEALREIGARAQEMPAEEGYPTYLASRLAHLYERAGRVKALGTPERAGAVTFISAVSPPGGDFSEPVTQASLRVAGALWALDPGLAHRRQFPAIDWETSYTLYDAAAGEWFASEVAAEWPEVRRALLRLLQRDAELREVAGLVGPDALEDADRLVLRIAQLVREYVIGQSAFDPADAYSPPAKTFRMAAAAVRAWQQAEARLKAETPFEDLGLDALAQELDGLRAGAARDGREETA